VCVDAWLDSSGKEVWDVVADGSVDVVYNNYDSPGNADKAMRKLKPGGFYISIAGSLSKSPKAGVTQRQFLVNATRPRDLVRCKWMCRSFRLAGPRSGLP
jgi:hypothetical protein